MAGNTIDIPEIAIIVIAIVACLFSTATSAIVIKTFNDNNDYKQNNIKNFRFVLVNLVISIICLLAAFIGLGFYINNMRKIKA